MTQIMEDQSAPVQGNQTKDDHDYGLLAKGPHDQSPGPGTIRLVLGFGLMLFATGFESLTAIALVGAIGAGLALSGQDRIQRSHAHEL